MTPLCYGLSFLGLPVRSGVATWPMCCGDGITAFYGVQYVQNITAFYSVAVIPFTVSDAFFYSVRNVHKSVAVSHRCQAVAMVLPHYLRRWPLPRPCVLCALCAHFVRTLINAVLRHYNRLSCFFCALAHMI